MELLSFNNPSVLHLNNVFVMAVETAKTAKIPGFTYREFDVPAIGMLAPLIGDLGTGEPAYKLAPKSTPLSWRVALYTVGKDLSLGIEDAESLPTPVKEAGRLVYSDAQARQGRGCWHKDGVYILPRSDTPKGMRQPEDDNFVLARYFKDIESFEDKDGWKINPSPNTREELVWLPFGDGSLVVPTMDGAYNPVTGTPFETIIDRKEAVKRWVSAGLTEEQTEKELSRFYKRSEGTAAVSSWSSDAGGPMCVFLGDMPDSGYDDLGSFPASRAAERREAPKNQHHRQSRWSEKGPPRGL